MRHILLSIGLVTVFCAGCQTSSWKQRQQELAQQSFSELDIPADRLDKIELLAEEVTSGSEARKQSAAQELAQQLPSEPDVLARVQIIETIGKAPEDDMINSVVRASLRDEAPQVREAGCRVLGRRRNKESLEALANVVRTDEDLDVRLEALRQLDKFEAQDGVVSAVAPALDVPDPAVQHRAVKILRKKAPEDKGDDVAAWKEYVKSNAGDLDAQPKSIASRISGVFKR